jgi:uncharacterized protein (TIGR02271 family)
MQPTDAQSTPTPISTTTIPVIEEALRVEKQVVETGRVVIRKSVHHETQTVDIPTQEELVHVERVRVNQVVETPPEVRYEGDTMIIPVLREEVVVSTRIVLVEELHVRKQTHTIPQRQEVQLRREEVHYERQESPPAPPESIS